MKENQIRRLPVVKDGELVGILSIRGLGWMSVTDIASIFHWLFVSYCKTLGHLLKSGAASFVPYFIEELITLYEGRGFNPAKEEPTTALASIREMLRNSQLAQEVRFNEVEKDKYRFEVQNCMFAAEAHPFIEGAELTCPLSMVAAAILRRTTGQRVTVTFSTLNETGSITYLTVK
jgi:hypothetical protein